MPGPELTNFTFRFVGGRAARPGVGNLTLLAPRDSGATVAANVVRSYRTVDAVEADHDTDSLLALGASMAILNLGRFRAGAFADATPAAVGSRTFGAASAISSGQIVAADRPIYELTSATIDGVAYATIIYTAKSGAALTSFSFTGYTTPAIAINTLTGEFQSSGTTSGSGAGIILTYKVADLDPLLEQVLLQPAEVVTFAGWRFNAQYYGMYSTLVDWADINNLMVYAAVDDSVDPTNAEFSTLIAALRSDSFAWEATKLITPSDDYTVAYAAQQTASPPNGTLKHQPPPKGPEHDRTLPYTRSQYGDEVDPSPGTFHYMGGNAISLAGGGFVHTSDRAATDYAPSTDVLYHGTRRTLNATNALVAFHTQNYLTRSPTSALFDTEGLSGLRGAILAGLNEAVSKRYIAAVSEEQPAFELDFPDLADTTEADRRARVLNGVFYRVRINGVVHVVNFSVEVNQ